MTKVVIGTHPIHGTDFTISSLPVLQMLMLRNKEKYFYEDSLASLGDCLLPAKVQLLSGDFAYGALSNGCLELVSTPFSEDAMLGRTMVEISPDLYWHSSWGVLIGEDKMWSLRDVTEVRADPYLVELVEQEPVASLHGGAHFKVVEVPDGIEWELVRPDIGPMAVVSKIQYWR